MNIDDRPPTGLRANSHILGKFQMARTLQRVNRSRMAAAGHLEKLQMAKSLKRIIQFTVFMYTTQTIYFVCPRTLTYNDEDSKLISQGRVTSRLR